MPFYDSGVRYGSGARYGPSPIPITYMAKIIRNWIRMNRGEHVDLGTAIVKNVTTTTTMVPATNADFVDFSTRQTALNAAVEALADLEKQIKAARLAIARTSESLTKGVPSDIVALGFEPTANAPAPPAQPPGQVTNLAVTATMTASSIIRTIRCSARRAMSGRRRRIQTIRQAGWRKARRRAARGR